VTRPVIRTSRAPKPVGAYPHARRVGDLLFLSGVGPRLPETNEIPGNVHDTAGRLVSYDIEAQCRSVFANVRAILEASGVCWEDLVDVTVYLTDMARDFQAYNRLYAEHFRTAQPCRTTLGIASLPTPIAIELKCVAHVARRRPVKAAAATAKAGRRAPVPTTKARPVRRARAARKRS
jgi:2-aminomuconate deaminase